MKDDLALNQTTKARDDNKLAAAHARVIVDVSERFEARGRREGWEAAIRFLRSRADSHAGRWITMDPREALKDAAREMETITP